MAIRRDEAIILRTRDYSESDRLITFFSRNQGQLTGIAKGAPGAVRKDLFTPWNLVPTSLLPMWTGQPLDW
jgi:recombinational DNA repair protein (RecF pathway)